MGQPGSAYTPQYILADPLHQGTLYATSYGGVFRSVDSGATWVRLGLDSKKAPRYDEIVSCDQELPSPKAATQPFRMAVRKHI